jgi:sugar phosphate isomerase/epimerase
VVNPEVRLGAIPSEVDDRLDLAIPVLRELGISEDELSLVDGRAIDELDTGEPIEVRRRLAGAGLRVPVVGTELFKAIHVYDDSGVVEHLDRLERALAAASALGATVLRLYAFRRDGMVGLGNPSPIQPDGGAIPWPTVERIASALRRAGDLAAVAGMTLAVENVRSCWANSGVNTGRIVATTDHPAVRVCWDPANDHVAGGEPARSGYAAVRPFVVAAHLKDARIVDRAAGLTAWEPIGAGEVDVATQLRLLADDGFEGLASLETHWRAPNGSKADGSRVSWAGLLDAARRAAQAAA